MTDSQTDRQTDRRTEGQKSRQEKGLTALLMETVTDTDANTDSERWYQPLSMCTFIVDLEANRAYALIRLEMKPHLMGHADNQVWDKAPSQSADRATKTSLWYHNHLFKQHVIKQSKNAFNQMMMCIK